MGRSWWLLLVAGCATPAALPPPANGAPCVAAPSASAPSTEPARPEATPRDATPKEVPAAAAADGAAKSAACRACHGAEGDYPGLAGQTEKYLARQLKAFKKGDRKHDVMNAIAAQLSDADIAALAAHFSGAPPAAVATSPEAAKIRTSQMTFPADFPTGYVAYKSENSPEDGTVQKNYANPVAFKAARAGGPLPNGSIIVVVTSSARMDAKKQPVADASGAFVADKVQSYSAMEARAGWGKEIPEILRNDDWGYALFTADKRPRDVNQAGCLACHKPAAKDSYVFTYRALVGKASGANAK